MHIVTCTFIIEIARVWLKFYKTKPVYRGFVEYVVNAHGLFTEGDPLILRWCTVEFLTSNHNLSEFQTS